MHSIKKYIGSSCYVIKYNVQIYLVWGKIHSIIKIFNYKAIFLLIQNLILQTHLHKIVACFELKKHYILLNDEIIIITAVHETKSHGKTVYSVCFFPEGNSLFIIYHNVVPFIPFHETSEKAFGHLIFLCRHQIFFFYFGLRLGMFSFEVYHDYDTEHFFTGVHRTHICTCDCK